MDVYDRGSPAPSCSRHCRGPQLEYDNEVRYGGWPPVASAIVRRVRRPAEESCQFHNCADVVVLGLRREMADAHVLDHAPAKWVMHSSVMRYSCLKRGC